jgi:hypothetical protein
VPLAPVEPVAPVLPQMRQYGIRACIHKTASRSDAIAYLREIRLEQ